MNPQDADACYYLVLASYNLGRYDNVIDAYQIAFKTHADSSRLRTGLGLAFEAVGRAADAERELRAALPYEHGKSMPDFDPRVELSAFLYRQGRLKEALAALEEAVKTRPDSARAFFELARTLVLYGRLEEAVGRLQEAIRLDSNYGAAHLLLGRVYFRLGRDKDGGEQMRIGQKVTWTKP